MRATWWLTIKLFFVATISVAQPDSLSLSDGDSILIINADSTPVSTQRASGYRIQVIPSHLLPDLSPMELQTDDKSSEPSLDSGRQKKRLFREVALYIDYGKLIGYLTGQEQKNEGGFRLVFSNGIYFGGELGISSITPDNAYRNADYKVSGTYQRLGLGFIGPFSGKTNIGFGAMYGQATFEDEANPTIESPSGLFGRVNSSFARTNMKASWTELNFLTETRIAKNLFLGFNLRLRFLIDYDEQAPIDVYTIPGYGRTFDKSVPVANLIAKYSF